MRLPNLSFQYFWTHQVPGFISDVGPRNSLWERLTHPARIAAQIDWYGMASNPNRTCPSPVKWNISRIPPAVNVHISGWYGDWVGRLRSCRAVTRPAAALRDRGPAYGAEPRQTRHRQLCATSSPDATADFSCQLHDFTVRVYLEYQADEALAVTAVKRCGTNPSAS